MRDIIIIGAGAVGKHILINSSLYGIENRIIGYLDDRNGQLDTYFYLGPVDRILESDFDRVKVFLATSNPALKAEWREKCKRLSFINLIANNSWISPDVVIGTGNIIYPGCQLNHSVRLGDFNTINMNCSIGHDVVIESFASLAPGVSLAGGTFIGSHVQMGINSCTIQNIEINDAAVVGAGAAVVTNVLIESIVLGVPAKPKLK